jgi:branched-subunit amino acid aminotransferase/4-amino-4-deoxychorismate lyase
VIAHTFPDGEGIFETILTVVGNSQFLAEHLTRARNGADFLGWRFPSNREIDSAVAEVISLSPVATKLGRLRLIFTSGGEIAGSHDFYERWESPARLTLSSSVIDESGPLIGIKALPYRDHLEILGLAQRSGFDDAIRLNSRQEVAETSVANILFKVEGRWITPNESSGILPGVVRAKALELFPIEEASISLSDLERVESAFLMNSLKGFQPVESIDARRLAIDAGFMKKVASLSQFGSVG